MRRPGEHRVGHGRAGVHLELAIAGGPGAALRHRLAVHAVCGGINLADVLIKCGVGRQSGVRVKEGKERIHLAHDLDNL